MAPYILLDEYDTPLGPCPTIRLCPQLHGANLQGQPPPEAGSGILKIAWTSMTPPWAHVDNMMIAFRQLHGANLQGQPPPEAGCAWILKIAQESIFSDFNNPRVSSPFPAMKDCFGFTEAEVEKMTSYFGLESKMDGIKEWYNGYIFGGETVIYNPWSIVNYLSSPDEGLKPHWISTSDNRLVKEVIKLKRRDAIMTTEKLLRKEEVRKPLLTNIPYTQIESDPDVVWSFLLHSGYLKASEMHQEELGTSWRLSIPNKRIGDGLGDRGAELAEGGSVRQRGFYGLCQRHQRSQSQAD